MHESSNRNAYILYAIAYENAADCICVWRVVNCSVTLRRVYYMLCTLPGVPLMLSITPQCKPLSQLYRRENWGAEMTALFWAWRLVRMVFLLPPPRPDACGLLVAINSWFVRQRKWVVVCSFFSKLCARMLLMFMRYTQCPQTLEIVSFPRKTSSVWLNCVRHNVTYIDANAE